MPKKSVAVTLRKPQTPADAEAFVGSNGVTAPLPAAVINGIDTASELQHGARKYREVTLYLPSEVARELSLYCMDRNCDLSRVVGEAVSKHLATASAVPGAAANAPRSSWGGTFEILVEQSRLKLSTLWALRRWGTSAE